MKSSLAQSDEYREFRSSVPLKHIWVGKETHKEWQLYDVGPRSIKCPLLFLPPLSGSADVYFKQMLSLSARGLRVISVSYPVYWSVDDFCSGLLALLDHLELDSVHLFGTFLGAFLAQKFAERMYRYTRVASLVLCQAFLDTAIFNESNFSTFFWLVPGMVLKNKVLNGLLAQRSDDRTLTVSVDFMAEQVSALSRDQLASRLTLSSHHCRVQSNWLQELPITLVYALDSSALSQEAVDETRAAYPQARLADLNTGGNYPFLTRAEELDVFVQVHIRQFLDTSLSPSTATIKQVSAPPQPVT